MARVVHQLVRRFTNIYRDVLRISGCVGGYYNDVYSLSHEIIEWMDDPFGNYVPGWNYAFVSDDLQCDSRFASDLLETADPVEILTEANVSLPGTTFTYHVTEGMFIDFYTRASHSRSINGQYSFFEIGGQYGVNPRRQRRVPVTSN